jgi:outer membrane biogenesis lipoprotein LolB
MKKSPFFAVLIAAAVVLTGCSTTPKPKPVVQQPLFKEMQKMSTKILQSGGMAVVGIGESKSLELALNKAKSRGRVELAQMLETKVEALQKDFMEETGLPEDAEILAQFSSTAQIITSQQIQGSVAQELQYETIGGTVTAYALMVLDPSIIANQLAKEKELYTRFQATKAFENLDKEIKEYEAYKASQKM